MISKEEFFDAIREDYDNAASGADSFLFRYFAEQRMKKAQTLLEKQKDEIVEELRVMSGRERKDGYLLLQATFLAYKKGKLPFQDYKNILGNLSTGDDFIRAGFTDANKAETIRTWKKPEDCAQIHKICSDRMLIKVCDDFFYDAGYRKGRRVAGMRKQHDILDMFFAFENSRSAEDDRGVSLPVLSQAESRETSLLEDETWLGICEALVLSLNSFPILRSDKEMVFNRTVFLPLYIDAKSGAQLVIVGRDLYEADIGTDKQKNEKNKKKQKDNVRIAAFVFYGVDQIAGFSKEELLADLQLLEVRRYSSVKDAFSPGGFPAISEEILYSGYAAQNSDEDIEDLNPALFRMQGENAAFLPFFLGGRRHVRRIMEKERLKEEEILRQAKQIHGRKPAVISFS